MSRAGRGSGPAAKKRELHARLRTAVAEHQSTEAPAAPVELPPDVAVQFRAQRLYGLCKTEIVRHYPPLWPPEAQGMNIAEQWIQNIMRRMQEVAIEQMRARAAEAGIALPS